MQEPATQRSHLTERFAALRPRSGAACLLVALGSLQAAILIAQAFVCSPTQDELGQLTASIATAQTGDPGYYRVNPPLTKLISGLPVVALRHVPLLSSAMPTYFHPGNRSLEITMPRSYIQKRLDGYRWDIRIGRLPRVAVIMLATVIMLRWLPSSTAVPFALLWCLSPLMLGHGWTVMPDALSGAAMLGLLITSLVWLRRPKWETWLLAGIAWGLAISTKFTFCPLYLLWPIGLMVHQAVLGKRSAGEMTRLLCGHLGQGVVALLVVWMAYNFSEIGVRFSDHHFVSERMRGVFGHSLVEDLSSPFPKQFLVGIDEQQLDLERGHPTYVLGTWYPDGVWWYYLFGLAAKQSMLLWLMLVLLPFAIWRLMRRGDRETLAMVSFAAASCTAVIFVLSIHSRMGLNVRYAIPALPGLYLAIAGAVGSWWIGTDRRQLKRFSVVCCCGLAVGETIWVFPNHFAYINPLVGGIKRVPSVLHDSNFDGGQDIWRLENRLAGDAFEGQDVYLFLNTKIPAGGFDLSAETASVDLVKRVLKAKTDGEQSWTGPPVTLIVSRGYEAPMPWTALFGTRLHVAPAVSELLRLPPDEWVTPTIVCYEVTGDG